jgi:serine phosphatase RsbU (regulator of sigma subunit)
MFKGIRKVVLNIVDSGVTPDMSFASQKKAKLVNGICLYGLTVTATFGLIALFRQEMARHMMWMTIFNVASFGQGFYCNRKKHYLAAHFILCIYIPTFLAFATVGLPEESAADISILGLAILPVFLFEKNKYIIPLIIYCMLVYVTIQLLGHGYFGFQSPVTNHRLSPPYFFGVFFAFLEIYIFTYMFKSEHTRYEKTIIEKGTELEMQKSKIELQRQEIVSSITYAKRIQSAILPDEKLIRDFIPDSFVLYKPKDIVSGDFFWFCDLDDDTCIIVAADCTGHGVPGAIMTVIGSTLLNQIVVESKTTSPIEILKELDKLIGLTLKQEKYHQPLIRDGMDLGLLKVDKKKKEVTYTNAKRPAILVRNKEIKELKASKHTLDGLESQHKEFEEVRLKFESGDKLYLFTDGCTDQFGGKSNKKFMIKRLREVLVEINGHTMTKQKEKLHSALEDWVGDNEQTDDILLIGIGLEG